MQVDVLKAELSVQEVELTKKNIKAEELIKVVQKETEKVKFEKDKGRFEILISSKIIKKKTHLFKST